MENVKAQHNVTGSTIVQQCINEHFIVSFYILFEFELFRVF